MGNDVAELLVNQCVLRRAMPAGPQIDEIVCRRGPRQYRRNGLRFVGQGAPRE